MVGEDFRMRFVKRHRPLLLLFSGLSIFLLLQWHSIYFKTCGRASPIGLYDSDFYISKINYFREIFPFGASPTLAYYDLVASSFDKSIMSAVANFHGVEFGLLWGLVAKALGITAQKAFILNFYAGIAAMGLVLLLLTSKFCRSSLVSFLVFFAFAVYAGSPIYHGFYWVVPSFYCLLLFILCLYVFNFSKRWPIWGAALVPALLFSHVMGIPFIAMLGTSLAIHAAFSGGWKDAAGKIAFMAVLTVAAYSTYLVLMTKGIVRPVLFEHEFMPGLVPGISTAGASATASSSSIFLSASSSNLMETMNSCNNRNVVFFYLRYFVILSPLAVASFYLARKGRCLHAVSTFLACLAGFIGMSFLTKASYRMLLPLDFSIILLYSVAAGYFLHRGIFILKRRGLSAFNPFSSGGGFRIGALLAAFVVAAYAAMLWILEFNQLSIDFTERFRRERILDENALSDYVAKLSPKDKLIFAEYPEQVSTMLSFHGLWSREIRPLGRCLLLEDKDWRDNFRFIAFSPFLLKTKKEVCDWRRHGMRVYFPEGSSIGFDAPMPAGRELTLIMEDNGMSADEVKELSIEIGGVRIPMDRCAVEKIKMSGMGAESIPYFSLPWYRLAHMYIMRRNPDYHVVRISNRCLMPVSPQGESHKGFSIVNNGRHKYIAGKLKVIDASGGVIFEIDFDKASSAKLAHSVSLQTKDRRYPLTWADAKPSTFIKLGNDSTSKLTLELDANFGDIKAFKYKSLE